ncbi:hypothetical protein [Halorussus halobius]|uniref:hypothetical protein n=1 Tax=Halorussus halobius TaxID=1710537 RepID=UPI001093349F|nr:hypothetical protein [Halorussus halobius]
MSTYGPEVTFDLPSGDDRVQQLVDAADLDHGDTQHYRDGQAVDDDLHDALAGVITTATHDRVDLSGFELHTIDVGTRVEITGSFSLSEPASDFETFATEGAT